LHLARHATIFYFTLIINHPQGHGACILLDLCFRGGWAGVQALEVPFDDVEATELLDDRHRRWHIHPECDGGVRGAGAYRELFPGSPDGLPHRAVHRGREKERWLARCFRREDTLLVAGAVDELDIELLRDGVNCGDLVRPCAVVNDHAVGVRHVLLVCEEAHSLDECAFYLSESRAVFRAAHFHWRRFCMSSFYLALTWPRSTAGFRLCPQSYMMSLRRIVVAPVRTSISTSLMPAP